MRIESVRPYHVTFLPERLFSATMVNQKVQIAVMARVGMAFDAHVCVTMVDVQEGPGGDDGCERSQWSTPGLT